MVCSYVVGVMGVAHATLISMTSEGPSFRDEYLRDANGKLIYDRFGRPVRRRPVSNPGQAGGRIPGGTVAGSGSTRPTGSQPGANAGRGLSQPAPTRFEQFPAQRPQQQAPGMGQPGTVGQVRQQSPAYYGGQYAQSPRQQQGLGSGPGNSGTGFGGPSQLGSTPLGATARRLPQLPKLRVRPRGCLTSLVWLLVVAVVISIGTIFWVDSKLNRIEAFPSSHISDTAGTNWLLVGSDSREGFTEEDVARLGTGGDIGSMRTDTIMVLHLPVTGSPTLLSIPRDSYVSIPGYGMDKINAAFAVGGAPLLTQTVEQATGLRINHYAEIGMAGLANVVDAVGGIEVCPAEAIDDPLANLNIQAGCQKIDGPTALGYVRTRATAMGDLDRVARQREFFSSLVGKLTSTSTLINPFRFWPTVSSVAGSFTVNEKDHAWHLLRVALAMRGGVETTTVPVGGFEDTDVGNVVLWDDTAAQELFNSLR